MKILKSNIFKKRKCEFGNFELEPDNGWKISQSFVDFESGLLVVSTSDENESNWKNTGFGSRTIPNKEYIIDLKIGEFLPREMWSNYFSYKPKEIISDDGKYKLITTRIHNIDRDSDSIQEELIEISSNKIISSGKSLAFNEKKRETALESLYREQEEILKRKAELDDMPTLSEFLEQELKKTESGQVILDYFNSKFIFKLVFNGSLFELSKVQSKYQHNVELDSLNYQREDSFNTIEDFAAKYLNNKEWFLDNSPFNKEKGVAKPNQVLKKFVVEFFNRLREKHDFTFEEYNKIQQWENFYYQPDSVKPKEYKQYCSSCKKSVSYYPRYPKYICSDCASKKKTNKEGLELSFSNVGMSGGLRVVYKKDGEIIKEDTSEWQKLCFIEGKRFIATEARFGGIVIQTEK
jgi:hypothetical protein